MKWQYLILAGLVLVGWYFWHPVKPSVLIVGQTRVKVQIAATERERQQGLSGRKSLGEDAGMLFVFDQPGRYGFWMKGMNFPLDFIWINQGAVVQITESVGIDQMSIEPNQPVNRVLEVNQGFAVKHQLKIGDKVIYEPVSN